MPDLDGQAQNFRQFQDQSQVNIIVAVPKPCPVLPLFAPKIKVGVSTRPVHAPDDTKTLPDFFDPRSLFPFHPFPDPGRNFFFLLRHRCNNHCLADARFCRTSVRFRSRSALERIRIERTVGISTSREMSSINLLFRKASLCSANWVAAAAAAGGAAGAAAGAMRRNKTS